MISKSWNKKILISIVIIFVLLLIAGGVFLWQRANKEKFKGHPIKKTAFVDAADYAVRDTLEGKIIESKKEGLTAKVPEGWEIRIYEEGVDLLSSEVEFSEYGGISLKSIKEKGGCGISIGILECEKVDPEIETDVEEIRYLIALSQEKPIEMKKEERYEVIKVDNRLALKEVIGNEEYVLIQIPIDNKIYFFDAFLFSERCIQQFNKFLETVSINR